MGSSGVRAYVTLLSCLINTKVHMSHEEMFILIPKPNLKGSLFLCLYSNLLFDIQKC